MLFNSSRNLSKRITLHVLDIKDTRPKGKPFAKVFIAENSILSLYHH